MPDLAALSDPNAFSAALFEKMKSINPALEGLALYEFRYGLHNLAPKDGWVSITLEGTGAIEKRIGETSFYNSIQLMPMRDGRMVLDETIVGLTRMLFVGLVTGDYSTAWVDAHFYFDVRGFFFLARTIYFTEKIRAHFGGAPLKRFEPRQKHFDRCQSIGYKAFMEANTEVDSYFIGCLKKVIAARGTPFILTIAGPTGAGKTEIVGRMQEEFLRSGYSVTSIEVDNFLLDRDEREKKELRQEAMHFELFKECLRDIARGKRINTPRYDFIGATSSHDPQGNLRPGRSGIEIEPADIIFVEGNFPFHIDPVAHLIDLQIVYLTDDSVRLKRKWKRDIDYRKKYDPAYLRNKYFRTQFLRAQEIYLPMMAVCDLIVDTTAAEFWAVPQLKPLLEVKDV